MATNRIMTDTPLINGRVHYVSYGTPGGEYTSQCRAAIVTEVGAWMQMGEPYDVGTNGAGSKVRTVTQIWEPEACALMVANPTGQFFNTVPRHEPDPVALTYRDGSEGTGRLYRGGTWHTADGCKA